MSDRREAEPERLSRMETLGAWLGLWTPPRDAVVPPIPWRTIAIGGSAVVAILAAIAVFAVPRVVENRQAARAEERRADAARHAAFLESVDREQRARRGTGRPDPGAGAAAERRREVRGSLLASAQAGIARDAESRDDKPVDGVDCEPFPRSLAQTVPAEALDRSGAEYSCVAVTARLDGDAGVIGMPFRLVVHFDDGRYAWCRLIPLGDKDRLSHPLPDACRLRD
jgi:hypothetical protein